MGEKIVVRNLRVVYAIDEGFGRRSQITAFEGLDLTVAERELVTIIGPRGRRGGARRKHLRPLSRRRRRPLGVPPGGGRRKER